MHTCKDCKHCKYTPGDNMGTCGGNKVELNRRASLCHQKAFQRNIDKWLTDDYESIFSKLKENISTLLKDKIDYDLFTLHDSSHCENVEKMAKAIVLRSNIDLCDLERFLISCAAWTHDLGMNSSVAEEYFLKMKDPAHIQENLKLRRQEHHNISCWFLQNTYQTYFKSLEDDFSLSIVRAISTIIQFHRKSEHISSCVEYISIKNRIIRIRLLSAIIRLADTLHKDATRFDKSLYTMLQIASFDRISRLHWLKSFVVSNLHLDPLSQTISIQLDIPDYNQFAGWPFTSSDQDDKEARDWLDRIRNLKYIIQTDIVEDLVVVNPVFSTHGMPTYVNANIQVSYIRGYSKEHYEDIKSVLSELDLLFSPNTSKIIQRTLDTLQILASTGGDDNRFFSNFNQLKGYLEEIYSERPCHVGLGKILDLMRRLRDQKDRRSIQKSLVSIVKKIDASRKDARNRLLANVNTIIPPEVQDIILLGFSSTVVKVLSAIRNASNGARQFNIYVLECSTKRRIGHSNIIEYNDGIHYATEIGKLGYKHIHLIPDLGLATLLENSDKSYSSGVHASPTTRDKKMLVLFGTNGIDSTTGDCGHTSGHLSTAIIAKEYGIPVRVVGDVFKIGKIEWNSTAIRKGNWLVTQDMFVDELNMYNVKTPNLREDRIPSKYIESIHTEEGICLIGTTEGLNKLFDMSKIADAYIVQLIIDHIDGKHR